MGFLRRYRSFATSWSATVPASPRLSHHADGSDHGLRVVRILGFDYMISGSHCDNISKLDNHHDGAFLQSCSDSRPACSKQRSTTRSSEGGENVEGSIVNGCDHHISSYWTYGRTAGSVCDAVILSQVVTSSSRDRDTSDEPTRTKSLGTSTGNKGDNNLSDAKSSLTSSRQEISDHVDDELRETAADSSSATIDGELPLRVIFYENADETELPPDERSPTSGPRRTTTTSRTEEPSDMCRISSTSNESAGACHKRSVSFTSIEVRDYAVVLGDHPHVSCGVPVSLGWDYFTNSKVDIDDYERSRMPRRTVKQMAMNYHTRKDLLISAAGYTEAEIRRAERRMTRVKTQRSLCDLFHVDVQTSGDEE